MLFFSFSHVRGAGPHIQLLTKGRIPTMKAFGAAVNPPFASAALRSQLNA